jgi:uncharacterized membrane protein YfcA
MRRRAIALLLLLAAARPALAQERTDQIPNQRLLVRGLAGGAAGWIVGAFAVGGPLARANPFDSNQLDDGLWTPGIVIGFELGQAIGIPTAVHLANQRRGDLRASLLASFALASVGTLLLWTEDFDAVFESPSRQAVLIAVPVAQLLSSIYIERRTASSRPLPR